jgi:hypothetical protein
VSKALFLRLLDPAPAEKPAALEAAVADIRRGEGHWPVVHRVAPEEFATVPGSPFAYWVGERVRRLFQDLPPFESEGRTAKVGLQTSDDFRFVRCWWEVAPERVLDAAEHGPDWRQGLAALQAWCRQRTFEGKRWVPFAKGGAYSPYYADLHLVVNWERDGEEIRGFVNPRTGRTKSRPQNTGLFFRPGLTWARRTQKGLNMRSLPAGATFGDKGSSIFSDNDDPSQVLGLTNSDPFKGFVAMVTAFGSYEVGAIQRVPFPQRVSITIDAVRRCHDAPRRLHSRRETNHWFRQPLNVEATDTTEEAAAISRAASDDYELSEEDLLELTLPLTMPGGVAPADEDDDDEEDADDEAPVIEPAEAAARLLSYAFGCAFGRWDVRLAADDAAGPSADDPFAPLPVLPPGALKGEDGLPLRAAPAGYPFAPDADGILVVDEGHPDDVVSRVRAILQHLFSDDAAGQERRALDEIGVPTLAAYFGRTAKRSFWGDHVARYSASRRRAPIYWLLQSEKGSYSVWLDYHRLDGDTLHKLLGGRYLEGKINRTRHEIELYRPEGKPRPGLSKQEEKRVAELDDLLVELEGFVDKIRLVTSLADDRGEVVGWAPTFEDGVVLDAAALHELIPWPQKKRFRGKSRSELETYWHELAAGTYDWAKTALRYWPTRVLGVSCASDPSIALAHGRGDQG